MSEDGNFVRYRAALSELEHLPRLVPAVPFLGLLLHDLAFLNDGNPTTLCPGVFNFTKLRRVAEPILFLARLARVPYDFPSDSRASATLHKALQRTRLCIPMLCFALGWSGTDADVYADLHVITDQDALYQCSLVVEPRARADS
jgi:hypothetical protein